MPNNSRDVVETLEGKKKYFFVVEGEKTENIYVREVAHNIKRDAIIEVKLLERIISSKSNQYSITKTISDYLDHNEQISSEQREKLFEISLSYEEEEITEEELLASVDELLGTLKDAFFTQHNANIIEQFKVLNEMASYEKDFDRICLILDRDYRSFKEFQYDEVLNICEDYNFLLGITNPNFEFYLLLHLDDSLEYEKSEILENRRITSQKKFVEHTLNEKMHTLGSTYKKRIMMQKYL